MPFLSVNRYLGLGKETSRGTAATPSIWIPVDPNPTLEPDLKWLDDKGLRGSPVEVYDAVAGVRSDAYNFKGNVFADTFPALLEALLGGTDTVTGTTAPYTHKIGLANDASTGSQPPSYTIVDVDNITEGSDAAKQVTAGQLSELSIDFSADGAVTYSGKMIGNPFTEVATPSSPSWSTEVFMPAWNGTITFGTVQSSVVMSGSLSLKRDATPVFTLGQQGPYRVWAGPLVVSGKFVFVAEASDNTFTNALARDHQSLTIEFADPVSSHSVSFQMSTAQLQNPKVSSDKAWEEINADFIAVANTTDATATGYAPVVTTTINGQSASY